MTLKISDSESRCKQLLVVGEDVEQNVVVCIEDNDDIFRVRDKLDGPEHRAMWSVEHCTRQVTSDQCWKVEMVKFPLTSQIK